MIHVIVITTAKPGMREAFLKETRANIATVLAVDGCIEYGPAVDADGFGDLQTKFGPDVFVVIEKWESAEALKAYDTGPLVAAYIAKTKDWVADRTIHILTPA
jgi:quinol monooxygenase YgiN